MESTNSRSCAQWKTTRFPLKTVSDEDDKEVTDDNTIVIDATNDWTNEERWGEAEACDIPEQFAASEGDAHQPRRPSWPRDGSSWPGRGSVAGSRSGDCQLQEAGPEQQADALFSSTQSAGKRF